MQKRRYSSGYHMTWKKFSHSKLATTNQLYTQKESKAKSAIKLSILPKINEINSVVFSSKYPGSSFTIANEPRHNVLAPNYPSSQIEIPYHEPNLDSQLVLTPAEIDNNYFINKKGKKKKYRRGLRQTLIIGGIILLLIGLLSWTALGLGAAALITGLFLPKPNKKSIFVTESLMNKMKNDKKANTAAGIGAGVITLIVIGGIIFFFTLFIFG
jgi:hypothetical protein